MNERTDHAAAGSARADAHDAAPAGTDETAARTTGSTTAADGLDSTGTTAGASEPATGMTSLSTLLGDSFEGGAACAADGTCD